MKKLQALLEKQPNDTFLLYGLALEHKKAAQSALAIELLDRVLSIDPNYCYAYHQKGLLHESAGDVASAKNVYREGIEAARRSGDEHARGEIQGALEMIE
jgi:Tfp pilus assembly protein PilF